MTQGWEHQGERGSSFMLRLLLLCTRLIGRTVTRLLLWPIALYFLLTAGSARSASRDYLRRIQGREPRWYAIARHFHTFAAVSLDRLFLLQAGAGQFDVRMHMPPEVEALTSRAQGCVLLLAHLGGYEAMRLAARDRALPLRVLLDLVVGRKLMSLLLALNPGLAKQIIDASDRGPDLVLKLRETLDQGCMVGIMADRATSGERAIEAEFLGVPARFAVGPWMLAAAAGVPVILAFCLYRGANRYDVHFELFSQRISLARGQREQDLQLYLKSYAARLEHYARLAPYNWFNFYDYWRRPAA